MEAVYTKVAKDFSHIMAPDLIPKIFFYIEHMSIGRYSSLPVVLLLPFVIFSYTDYSDSILVN